VGVASSQDVWAVGASDAANYVRSTLVEHWNGTAWSIVSSPNSGGYDYLSSVAVVSSTDVWAVGSTAADDNSPSQTLVEHWNGTAWSVVSSSGPGTRNNYLAAVAPIAANDVWAVGSYENVINGPYRTLIEHWNGTAWSVVPSINIGSLSN